MSKDKGMNTVEFAKYYQNKRYEFIGLSKQEIANLNFLEDSMQLNININLMEEMNKLIEAVNEARQNG